MIRRFLTAALAATILFGASLAASAQGTLAPGHVLGNGTSSTRTPTDTTLTALMDQAFCSTNGAVGVRLSGTWQCSSGFSLDGSGNVTGGAYNKVTITAPASGSTLTIANGKTLTANKSITLDGNDGQTLTLNAALTVATNNGTLSFGAASKTLTVNNSIGISGTDGKTLTVSNSGTLSGGDGFTLAIAASKTVTFSNTLTFTGTDSSSVAFGAGGTVTYTSNNLSVFAATTSAQLAGVISDETGTGALVFANTPTLVTPVLGVATATTINKYTFTAPATGATLAIADGKTFTVSNTVTLTAAADGGSYQLPSGSDTLVTLGATQTLTAKTLTSPTINGGNISALTNLGIRSTGAAFDLIIASTEVFTANRTLTVTLNNANRSYFASGNLTLGSDFTTSGAFALTLTVTGTTNVTLPTSGTLVNTAVTTLSSLVSIGTITTGTWNATVIGLAYGGTGQTSAALSRAAAGLNIDEVTTFGNANYSAVVTDRVIATSSGFTAQRTVTLPAVASYNPGQVTVVIDSAGAINGANTMVIATSGGDTINGASSITVTAQYGGAVLWPVGSGKWGYIAASAGGGSGTVTAVTAGAGLSTGAGSSTISTSGTLYPLFRPQGRLTLASGTPVTTTDQNGKTVIYYDCYNGGNVVPYYNGTADATETIASCEVSMTMVSAASAGQVVSGQVYDIWWVHSGANRICIAMSASGGGGGGWASDTSGSNTARGTGYSQLDTTTRPYVTNKNAITNCFNGSTNYGSVSANQATYLGTFYATANGQTTDARLNRYLFNNYNAVQRPLYFQEPGTNWNYTTATYRAYNNGTNTPTVNMVIGQANYAVHIQTNGLCGNSSGGMCATGIGVDSTTVNSGTTFSGSATTGFVPITTIYDGYPGVGAHAITMLEISQAVGTTTFYGTNGVSYIQAGMNGTVWQ